MRPASSPARARRHTSPENERPASAKTSWRDGRVVECIRLESEQTVKGLGSSNLPLSSRLRTFRWRFAIVLAASFSSFACDVDADQLGAVAGRVVDARGVAIATAAVTVFASSDGARPIVASTFSRKDGSFNAIGIRDNDILVVVEARGFEPQVCPYRLAPGGETRVTFALRENASPIGKPTCPPSPVGGGQTQDVYIVR